MSIRLIGFSFIATIFILFVTQTIWLYYSYSLEKNRIAETIKDSLSDSIEDELLNRMKQTTELEPMEYDNDKTLPEDEKFVSIDGEDGLHGGVLQSIMIIEGLPMNLLVVDSLFQQKLNAAELECNYILFYRDSTHRMIESIGDKLVEKKLNVFESDSIRIVNKSYVHVLSDISLPVVFQQMIGLTVISFFILFILILLLVYQFRFIYSQYRLNKLREDFSHALTHDLKSPLNSILITLTNYQNGLFAENSAFREKATSIAIDQVLSIQALVEKILTIAQLEDNKLNITRSQINLPVLIQKLTESYSLSSKKTVMFQTSFVLNDTLVFVDPVLFENMISNLIDNAIKYSGKTVTIRILLEIKGNELYIRIKDDGIGISPKDQEKIFEKFERGEAIRRKDAKGFGLGLNYVKQVALAHQGTIAVSSRKGRGSEFMIMIPLLLTPYVEELTPNKENNGKNKIIAGRR